MVLVDTWEGNNLVDFARSRPKETLEAMQALVEEVSPVDRTLVEKKLVEMFVSAEAQEIWELNVGERSRDDEKKRLLTMALSSAGMEAEATRLREKRNESIFTITRYSQVGLMFLLLMMFFKPGAALAISFNVTTPVLEYQQFSYCTPGQLGFASNVTDEFLPDFLQCGNTSTVWKMLNMKCINLESRISTQDVYLVQSCGLNITCFKTGGYFLPLNMNPCDLSKVEPPYTNGNNNPDLALAEKILALKSCVASNPVILRRTTIGTVSNMVTVEKVTALQLKDKLVITMSDSENTKGATVCMSGSIIVNSCSVLSGLKYESVSFDIIVYDVRSPVVLSVSQGGAGQEVELMLMFETYCEVPACTAYMCSDGLNYLGCEYPLVRSISIATLALLAVGLFFTIGKMLLKLSFFGWAMKKMWKRDKPRKERRNSMSLDERDMGMSDRNKVLSAGVMALLFGTNPASAALVTKDCPTASSSIWQTAISSGGLSVVSDGNICTPGDNGYTCTLVTNLVATLSNKEGDCRKWLVGEVDGKPVTAMELILCSLGSNDTYISTYLATYGEPVFSNRVASSCPLDTPPDCDSWPEYGCAAIKSDGTAHVGWGSGCFIDSQVGVCGVTSFRLIDLWAGFDLRFTGNVPFFAAKWSYTETDPNGYIQAEREIVNCFDSGGLPSNSEIGLVNVEGSLTSQHFQVPSGKKILWDSARPTELFTGYAAEPYTYGNGWGNWQTGCFNGDCDCHGRKSVSFPQNSVRLSDCSGPNGGWACTVTFPDTNVAARQEQQITRTALSHGAPRFKVNIVDNVPLLDFVIKPTLPTNYLMQITLPRVLVKQVLTEACPVASEQMVAKDNIGSGEPSVVCFKVSSTCTPGIVSVTANYPLLNSPSCNVPYPGSEECCVSIVLNDINSYVSIKLTGRTTTNVTMFVEGKVVTAIVGNGTTTSTNVVSPAETQSAFGLPDSSPWNIVIWVVIAVAIAVAMLLGIFIVMRVMQSRKTRLKVL